MQKIKLLIIPIIMSFFFGISVNAFTSAASCEHDLSSSCSNPTEDYISKKSSFDAGLKTYTVTGTQSIMLYGKSECNGTSCTISYAGNLTNVEDAIARSVTCTNGEKNVIYQYAGSGNTEFKASNAAKLIGTVYWDEDYQITCTSDSSGDSTIKLGASGSASSNGTSGGTSGGNQYQSSTTTNTGDLGVNTYFVVLGIIGLVSYVFMIFVKKFNLFKRI